MRWLLLALLLLLPALLLPGCNKGGAPEFAEYVPPETMPAWRTDSGNLQRQYRSEYAGPRSANLKWQVKWEDLYADTKDRVPTGGCMIADADGNVIYAHSLGHRIEPPDVGEPNIGDKAGREDISKMMRDIDYYKLTHRAVMDASVFVVSPERELGKIGSSWQGRLFRPVYLDENTIAFENVEPHGLTIEEAKQHAEEGIRTDLSEINKEKYPETEGIRSASISILNLDSGNQQGYTFTGHDFGREFVGPVAFRGLAPNGQLAFEVSETLVNGKGFATAADYHEFMSGLTLDLSDLGTTIEDLEEASKRHDEMWNSLTSHSSLYSMSKDESVNLLHEGASYHSVAYSEDGTAFINDGFSEQLLALDAAGNELWAAELGEYFHKALLDDERNIYVTLNLVHEVGKKPGISKYNSEGEKLWSVQAKGESMFLAALASENRLVLLEEIPEDEAGEYVVEDLFNDATVVSSYDSEGNWLWSYQHSSKRDVLNMIVDKDGFTYLLVQSENTGFAEPNSAPDLVCINPEGVEIFSVELQDGNVPSYELANYSMVINEAGSVCVCGSYWVVCYADAESE